MFHKVLFLVRCYFYINELENSTSIYDFSMYADDTTLFCIIDLISESNYRHIVLNNELEKTNCWLMPNKIMYFYVSKTKYMIFRTNHEQYVYPDLRINSNIIESVFNFNFLGLLVLVLNGYVILINMSF